jgi:FixJ family two-component response regulator
MRQSRPTLFVVDDDQAVTDAIKGVGSLMDLPVKSFSSAEDFLNRLSPDEAGCLLLDFKLPGATGLDLQESLISNGCKLPIIMMSGHATTKMAVTAMKRGAVTFLEKPFALDKLCDHLRRVFDAENSFGETDCRNLTLHEDTTVITYYE